MQFSKNWVAREVKHYLPTFLLIENQTCNFTQISEFVYLQFRTIQVKVIMKKK